MSSGNDIFAKLARFFAELGHEVALLVTDPEACAELLERAGYGGATPTAPSGAQAQVVDTLNGLRDAPSSQGKSALEDLADVARALVGLALLIQELATLDSEDKAWNAMCTMVELIAMDRWRDRNPQTVALMTTLHLVVQDRVRITDLLRAKDNWGTFLLGNPPDSEAKADNLSLIVGAVFTVVSAILAAELKHDPHWRQDMLFGWDVAPGTTPTDAERLLQRMSTLRLKHHDGNAEESFELSAAVAPSESHKLGLFLSVGGGVTFTCPIGDSLELELSAQEPDAVNIFFGDPCAIGSGVDDTSVKIEVHRKKDSGDAWLIGAADGTHLEIGTFSTGLTIADPMRFKLSIGDGALVIPKSEFGFMGSVIPGAGVKFTFDFDFMFDTNGKISIDGGAGMAVTLPVNKSLAFLRVRSVTLAFALGAGAGSSDTFFGGSLAATVAFGLDFSALKIKVDDIGAKLAWSAGDASKAPSHDHVPNLGPAGGVSLDFVAPKGIGLEIDAGPIKGGGFFYFDPEHRTYAGVLEAALSLCGKGIQIKAAGLLREKDDGWDFVLVVSAQFDPAIDLFLGLTLAGVGGMLGINVAVSVDRLESALHDGGIAQLLFPDDPLGNAPAIISMLESVFPHHKGDIVVGPMLQLGYGKPDPWITLSVAVVVAAPSPTLLMLIGRLHLAVPKSHPIANIEADFLGVIDFQKPAFSFDASLVHSQIATFPLTGDMALRAGPPGFLLSIGGFNPQFHPPADIPKLNRLAIDISASSAVKIHAASYFAITSNTFQTGLDATLDVDAHVASIHGWLKFDALLRWEPRFYFSVHLGIGLELRVAGQTLAGVSVDLLLEGPGPWHFKGTASVSLLFFTVHAHVEKTWGVVSTEPQPPQIDASASVALALSADGAWASEAPDGDAWFTFRDAGREAVGVHPYGRLVARQQQAPIGIPITHIGKSRVKGGSATVTLSAADGAPPSKPMSGQFASAQFMDLTDSEKLSRPSFETYQDGIAFGSDEVVISQEQTAVSSYETVVVHNPDKFPLHLAELVPLQPELLDHGLGVGAVARSGLHFATLNDGPHQPVAVKPPSYSVVAADTLKPVLSQAFTSSAAAHAAAATLDDPVVVVASHEQVH